MQLVRLWKFGQMELKSNYYERLDPNYFEPLSDLPKASETIDDVKNERFTYLELMVKDRLTEERKSLKI